MRAVLLLTVVVGGLWLLGNAGAETERGFARAEALVTEGHSPPRSVSAHPVTPEAKRWHPNPGWMRNALCIYRHENGGYGWHANTGNGQFGGLQFSLSTWRRAGVNGRGYPHQWSAKEQLYRAWRLWKQDGGSFREWSTAGMCGLR